MHKTVLLAEELFAPTGFSWAPGIWMDHHSPIADDQIHLDPEGCAKARDGRHVLRLCSSCRHDGLRLCRRD